MATGLAEEQVEAGFIDSQELPGTLRRRGKVWIDSSNEPLSRAPGPDGASGLAASWPLAFGDRRRPRLHDQPGAYAHRGT